MTAYQQIKNLKNKELYSSLLKAGIIPLSINSWYEMYDYFQVRLIVNNEFEDRLMRSYAETSEAFNCSYKTIMRAVKFMNE